VSIRMSPIRLLVSYYIARQRGYQSGDQSERWWMCD
jgi:hypothetical protein